MVIRYVLICNQLSSSFIRILASPTVPGSMAQEVVEELSESLGDICEELYGTRPKAVELLAFSPSGIARPFERALHGMSINCLNREMHGKLCAYGNLSSGAVARRTRDAAVLRSRAFAIHVTGGKMGTS